MKFDDYPIAAELKQSLQNQGFKRPTDIQFKAIPAILKGEDVLGIAQTGTGKTAAFAIPILNRLHQQKRSSRSDGIRCLVLVPTHELAIQINGVFAQIGQHTKVNTFAIYGGVEQDPQIQKLQKGLDVLVATPGRVFDLVAQGHLKLGTVETLVLDEADHMLDLGFYPDVEALITHLPKSRQTLFFSATINKKIKKLAYSLVRKAIRIQISPRDPVGKNINHAIAAVEMDDKRFFLERIIREREGEKILVFVRTKVRAERVSKAMSRVEIETFVLHGDKDQSERREVMEAFRQQKAAVLIATDVSARGIDIPDVQCVINYDLPDHPETYVHRVGRTGRGRNKGQAISFHSKSEKEYLEAIEAYVGRPLDRLTVTKGDKIDTRALSEDHGFDWRKLMQEAEDQPAPSRKKRKKRK